MWLGWDCGWVLGLGVEVGLRWDSGLPFGVAPRCLVWVGVLVFGSCPVSLGVDI